MPTARELLEQADALMRRNRAGAGTGAPALAPPPAPNPPTVSPTSGIGSSPRSIQREPIAPSVARTSLPVDPTESPAIFAAAPADEAPEAPPADPPAGQWRKPEAEFPMLTEAIEPPAETPAAPLDDLADDVPLLTDAVEEIDVGIVDEGARGEPSFWELTARGESSVLGPAPDSVVVVPPPGPSAPVVPQSPPEGRDPLGLDQPPPASPASAEARDPEAFEADERAESSPWPEERSDPPGESAEVDELPTPPLESGFPLVPDPGTDPWDAVLATAPPAESEALAPFAAPQGESPNEEAQVAEAYEALAGLPVEPSAQHEALAGLPVEPSAQRPAPPAFSQVSALDEQRIREIAEEIGMQVLQRIDIFTDTTLRAQLGERLRPAVDRAAADLVAAINEHVGELLRAQISDAIAREIESWRNHR